MQGHVSVNIMVSGNRNEGVLVAECIVLLIFSDMPAFYAFV